MKLYIVRHGETEWNVKKKLQGQLDSPLTMNGKKNAQLLAKRLAFTHFDSITSSPSGRAVHTAGIVKGNRRIIVAEDERLLEIHHGSWQGKMFEEIKEIDPERHDHYMNHPELFEPGSNDAESLFDVLHRVQDFLVDIESKYQSGNHLIVTHGVVVKMLQMIAKGNTIKQIWEPPNIDGTSLTVIQIEKGVRKLLAEGDIAHTYEYFSG